MRKSKYDQSSLPVQDSKSIDSDDNISKIENRVDFETELVNLTNQIKDIKDVIQELRQIKAFVDSSVSTFEESAQALKAAVKTSNNISNAIKYSEIDTTIKIILEGNILKFISKGDKIKDKDAIFKRYIRENQSLGGHGIGLSIVKDICDKYDIKIEVISLNGENIFSYTFLPHISHT